jgi:probable rRNA maturation factor
MTGNPWILMTIELDIQIATDFEVIPKAEQFELWAGLALKDRAGAELTLRLVDREESSRLNGQYRGKDGATNVLSFPAELPPGIDVPLLGDIVICAPLVAEQARQQGKSTESHWAHLVVHGVLHLLGHDHQTSEEAEKMESLEVELLASVGIANPYL